MFKSLKGKFYTLPNFDIAVLFFLKPQRIQRKIKGKRIFIFFPPSFRLLPESFAETIWGHPHSTTSQ
jgi:hypothetical protein